ncbi:MAG: TrkH family potassium uptake protein [Candidatus Altiarchaeota archaeon]|nr:TrkH family potassium uptake protein [Candidatus Altiarchaeota archaeon]
MFRTSVEDIKIALHELSEILRATSFVFLVPIVFTLLYFRWDNITLLFERVMVFLVPFIIVYLLHLLFGRMPCKYEKKTKHIMMAVSMGWILIAAVGAIPYFLSGTLGPLDSFFESMSGWTTTGMTMIEYPENLLEDKKDILFYRSFTQWIGGVGIIVLTMIVFLREGTAAIEYYSSEVGSLKLKPSIRKTVKETWKIYILYTIACTILLFLVGMDNMDLFDALNHSMTALPTGGFSTHSESIYFFQNPLVELILIVFMMAGGISFIIHYRAFEGKKSHISRNIEFRYMVVLVLVTTAVLFIVFLADEGALNSLRISLFQTVSILTTTGFGTADIAGWPVPTQTILLLLMLIGGSYGSTGSGVKMLRAVVIVKALVYSIKRFTLPKSVMLRLTVGDNTIDYDEITYVFAFFTTYLLITFVGAFILTAVGYGGYESASASLSAISNVGPCSIPLFIVNADGKTVTNDGWFRMPDLGKITLMLLMWVGRLEIFPVLVLFTIFFKKKRRR